MSGAHKPLAEDPIRDRQRTPGTLPLYWRVFAINALVLALATAALALSPATLSSPIALWEAIVLVVGLGAMVAVNFALLRRTRSPSTA